MRHSTRWPALLVLIGLMLPAPRVAAQGVTTGVMTGVVTDTQKQPVSGAEVIAIHLPSGTSYEGVTRADGRFSIPGMRVGGPYTVTVAHAGAGGGAAFEPATKEAIEVNLGVATDLVFEVRPINVEVMVTVTAQSDTVFSSARTGAATSVSRESIATLPTISGRIGDVTRLTPQSSGTSFAGQDNRLNNITVDGSYFNNSFGLGDQPGARTGVAPISLESIEQIQVSVAPFDVRQGNFVGANVNTVTRSGTNSVSASVYHRFRNESFVGTDAHGLPYNPGDFETRQTGLWGGGPIVKNKLFFFSNFEDEEDTRPLNTFVANRGEPVGGNFTRVLASDLERLSNYLRQNFDYETGPYEGITDATPNRRFLLRNDFNLSNAHKVSFRYTQLDSSSDANLSSSTSAGFGRNTFRTDFISPQRSNYSILENIKSGVGEWNWIIGNSMSNQLQVGYTSNDESRGDIGELFPFVDIRDGNQVVLTSFGSEPFTPNNELRYKTFQIKDDFMKFGNRHSLTFGFTAQHYESENVFFPLKQSAYVYNTFADWYADADGFRTNPNRTTSPVTLARFQVRYMNLPGLEKPIQPLKVWYSGGYAQDEWRPRSNVTVTAGLRIDIPVFKDTAFPNPNIDALTFRDETGAAVQYDSGNLPDPQILWSPRLGINWDLNGDLRTQIRGGTGVFTGPPLYVWISNQLGQTGVLTGLIDVQNTTAFPFHPDPDHYKPATVSGTPAASLEFNVTDPDFKFPQLLRNNIAIDHRLPGGLVGTAEFIHNKDLNGIYYINANLPAAQSAFVGPDNRARWVGPQCTAGGAVGPCVTRINQAPGNVITSAIVMKNQNVGSSWNLAFSASKTNYHGLTFKTAYSYGEAKNTIDPGSTAFASWAGNPHVSDPNNPGVGFSTSSPAHRVYVQGSYTRQYFGFGSTTISMFWEARNGANTSYVFAGDMNGDGANNNDLIYIPRDKSEMNFATFTCGVPATCTRPIVFTAEQQADAFEAYIQQDSYLRSHRGEYARRGAIFLPFVRRADLSIVQDVFKDLWGKRNSGQFRIDIQNFGNLLNSDWGVGQRVIQNQILTNGAADTQGRATYRMRVVNDELLTRTFETTATTPDVYQFMLSFRYTFQ
jgi:hypothetical protein